MAGPCTFLLACVAAGCACAQTVPAAPTSYVALDEVASFLNSLASNSDGRVSATSTVGKSVENRDLQLVQVGAIDATDKSGILLTAMHHGREPVGMLANLAFVRKIIVDAKAGDAEAAALLRNRRFLLIPTMNPDAYAWNVAHPRQRMARKNRKVTCNRQGRHYDEVGVDLNRNYPFEFDRDDEGSSPDPCRDDYRGPSAFSEPETMAMRDLLGRDRSSVTDFGANVTVALNWHSFGRLVNLPFAVRARPTPPEAVYGPLLALAKGMAGAMGWRYAHPWEGGLYSCNGEASDWMVDAHGILAYSPEVGPEYEDTMNDAQFEEGMWPGPNVVPGLVTEILKGMYVAAWAAGSNLQLEAAGLAVDAAAGATATACEGAPGLPAGSVCGGFKVQGLVITNAGARPPVGAARLTVIPATAMAHGPVCFPASLSAAGVSQPLCVESLEVALKTAQASGTPGGDNGQAFCTIDQMQTAITAEQGPRGGRALVGTEDRASAASVGTDGAGGDGHVASAVEPLLPTSVLRRLTAALRAEVDREDARAAGDSAAVRAGDTPNGEAALPFPRIPRRHTAGRIDLSQALEQALAEHRALHEYGAQHRRALGEQGPAQSLQSRDVSIASSPEGSRSLVAAPGQPLGATVWTDAHGIIPAWSRLDAAAASAATELAALRLQYHLPQASAGGAVACTAGTDGAYVSLSDEQTCAIYWIGCVGEDGKAPTPELRFRGPAGCMPCAAFRHWPSASVGSGSSPAPSPAAPSPGSEGQPSAGPSAGPSSGPGTAGAASPLPTPADANEAGWRDDATTPAGSKDGAPAASTAPGGGNGKGSEYAGLSSWPFDGSSNAGAAQSLVLGGGVLSGLVLGLFVYRRVTAGRGRYVRVRSQGEVEGEDDAQPASARAPAVPSRRGRGRGNAAGGRRPARPGSASSGQTVSTADVANARPQAGRQVVASSAVTGSGAAATVVASATGAVASSASTATTTAAPAAVATSVAPSAAGMATFAVAGDSDDDVNEHDVDLDLDLDSEAEGQHEEVDQDEDVGQP